MNNKDGKKITRFLSSLCRQTSDLEMIMIILVSTEVLHESEYIAIKEMHLTPYERNYAFYSEMIKKSRVLPTVYTELCKALTETNQEHLVDKLEQIHVVENTDRSLTDFPMSRKERQIICKNLEFLAATLSSYVLTELLTILKETEVFDGFEVEEIKCQPTTQNRVACFLMKLLNKRPNPFSHLIIGLRKTNNVHLVDKLLADLNSITLDYDLTTIKPIFEKYRICSKSFIPVLLRDNKWFDVNQPPVKNFTGRDNLLKNIHESIKSQQIIWETEQRPKFTIIWGLGGVGKTQTVRKYIYAYHRDDNVIWINAKDYSTIRESFYRLAENELGISTKLNERSDDSTSKPINVLVKDVYAFFSDQKTLFVFDNAENFMDDRETEGIDQFLPSGITTHIHPWVLITTQNKYWDSPQEFEIIEIHPFSKMESMEFIKKSLIKPFAPSVVANGATEMQFQDDYEDMVDLANLLQGLPLALDQAVDLIKQNKTIYENLDIPYGIKDYNNAFTGEAKMFLNHQLYKRVSSHNHPHIETVYLTGKLSMEGMKSERYGDEAEEVLNLIAYFHYQDLPGRMLLRIIEDQRRLGMALELLKKYSFIDIFEGMIQIHSVTQEVVRINLQDTQQEKQFLHQGMELLKSNIPTNPTAVLSQQAQKYFFSHAVTSWDFGVNYPSLVEKHSEYLVKIQGFLMAIGNPKKAAKWGSKTKNVLKLNPDDPYDPGMLNLCSQMLTSFSSGDNQTTQNSLTELVTAAGKMNKSEASNLADRDQTALNFIQSLAQYTNPSGKPLGFTNDKGVISALMNTLETMVKNPGSNAAPSSPVPGQSKPVTDAFSTTSLLNLVLGGLHSKTGNHPAALEKLKEVSEDLKTGDNSEGINDISSKINLCMAMCLQDMGKSAEAATLLNSGTTDPVNNSYNSLHQYERPKVNLNELHLAVTRATCLKRDGSFDEALVILKQTRDTLVREYSEKHPLRFSIDVEIGTVLIAQNKFEESYDLLLKTCDDSNAALCENDLTTLSANLALIWDLHKLKRVQEAIQKAYDVDEIVCSVFGRDAEIRKEIEHVLTLLWAEKDTEYLD